jgi:hypothetical protein
MDVIDYIESNEKNVKDNIKITGLGYLRQYLIICLNGQIKCMKNLSEHKQIPDQEPNAGHLEHGT